MVIPMEKVNMSCRKTEAMNPEFERTVPNLPPQELVPVKIKLMHPAAKIPIYQTAGAAGFDLHACESAVIHPGEWCSINLGVAFELPEGFEIQIRPRSGLSFKTGYLAKNTIGTLDADFRNHASMLIMNVDNEPLFIDVGDRICQGVLGRVPKAIFTVVEELSPTERGEKGFGSTGR